MLLQAAAFVAWFSIKIPFGWYMQHDDGSKAESSSVAVLQKQFKNLIL